MKALLCTGLLLALFSLGATLQCTTCQYGLKNYCENREAHSCPADTCLKGVLDNNIFSQYREQFNYSDCVDSQECHPGYFGFATAMRKYFRVKFTCCHSAACIEDGFGMHPGRYGPLECPACFSNSTTDCESMTARRCPYKATKCITFGGIMKQVGKSEVAAAFKGCATPDFCNYITTVPKGVMQSLNNWVSFNVNRAACFDAQSSSYTSGL
ncbi:Hypothetical predicted protein [Podarcis lilfordi]|uniref:UPAR/Ly6 domain-containing protein n=1 Tax=Podarcis lilfordi TaxID=74358 RepID=A0AA35KP49_9SAUR|nr:Hypothetical predicted protein [Podarcis lilfordi]